jgi:hypothetical protein
VQRPGIEPGSPVLKFTIATEALRGEGRDQNLDPRKGMASTAPSSAFGTFSPAEKRGGEGLSMLRKREFLFPRRNLAVLEEIFAPHAEIKG